MSAKKAAKKSARKTAKKSAKTAKKTAKKPAKKAAKKTAKKTSSPIERVRRICLSLPETTEAIAWETPTFRVKGKIFLWLLESSNHTQKRPQAWILSVGVEQDLVLRARPDRYFKPPYVGPSGWIGAWLDGNAPWGEIEELIRDAWRRRAPKRLAALLED